MPSFSLDSATSITFLLPLCNVGAQKETFLQYLSYLRHHYYINGKKNANSSRVSVPLYQFVFVSVFLSTGLLHTVRLLSALHQHTDYLSHHLLSRII